MCKCNCIHAKRVEVRVKHLRVSSFFLPLVPGEKPGILACTQYTFIHLVIWSAGGIASSGSDTKIYYYYISMPV